MFFEEALLNPNVVMFLQLSLAAALGLLLGIERTIAGKTAGMRTFALVSLGSCLFIVVAEAVALRYLGTVMFDPLRIAAGVVMGIGFIGSGLAVLHKQHLAGLTTAAGVWVASGIGISVGYKMYALATFTTFLTLFVFTVMWFVERKLKDANQESFHNGE